MTTQRLNRRHTLQILGAAVGVSVPLVACATMVHAASTGLMPAFATGALPMVLLAAVSLLAMWVWTETVD
ncbi:MAG: hypothetical protein H7Y22_14785 [Gemmatimonadaceae bacterium]|nr:hypothetical protein [Gloeobacterales cyanobacterium ES-bin-141]